MDDLKKKHMSTSMTDEHTDENLLNLKRLKDGYASIADKMGYVKFKPYLQRLFHSVETMLTQEVTEFKKIDAKYQDMVRQCHVYEKTLAMLKENNPCEATSFNESSNTYAFDDLTKVTPYLAPDLLQSTLGTGNGGASTSIQFRLPRRRSSLSTRQFVSTPLGPSRTNKQNVPIAQFDDDPSFVLTNSLGFQQQAEKLFIDAFTQPEPIPMIEHKDFSCQMFPFSHDKQCETVAFPIECKSIQTEIISTESTACQIEPNLNDCSIQTNVNEQSDFSCQFMPTSIDQTTETLKINHQTQVIQTDTISTNECSCQITPTYIDQQIETMPIVTQDIALQSSIDTTIIFCDQEIQTTSITHIDVSIQYELDNDIPYKAILPIVLSEELPVSHEIEISIENLNDIELNEKNLTDQECQTIEFKKAHFNEYTQTPHVDVVDTETQSSIVLCESRDIQTDPHLDRYSSSVYIVPTSTNQLKHCLSSILIMPKEFQSYSSPIIVDQEVQCDLELLEKEISIEIERETSIIDRRSIIQQQLDEKEKQMNRIIEEYAMLYGEYEAERRRNMDLTEARDRLADHIKVLSDELGDREINQEKLLIKSCQQSKLIDYMLPRIDCSPMLKKKPHSATSFRRLLPKFK